MKMKTKAQHTNTLGIRRKVELESESKLNKINTNRKSKLPLKNDLMIEVKELQEKYKELEEKSEREMEILKITNKNLEESNKKLIEKLESLKQQVPNGTDMKCYECDFYTGDKVTLKVHLWEKHSWSKYPEDEELDMSAGPRYCRKCEYQAEDGYDLDGHFWSEHDDDENDSKSCNFCDESFPTLNDLMMHKKEKHIEKVSFCWNFSTNTCVWGDEKCWFVHEPEPETFNDFRCDICNKEFNLPSEFLKHRKIKHEDTVPICKNFKTGKCIHGSEKCWFKHEVDGTVKEPEKDINEKLENNEVVQKIFRMLEKMTKRITDMEKNQFRN